MAFFGLWNSCSECAIMPRMKIAIFLAPFAAVSIILGFLQSDLGNFEAILHGLSELPLVAGMSWILMRQQDKHQETVDKLIAHFSARSEQKDEMWNTTFEKLLDTIAKLSTK